MLLYSRPRGGVTDALEHTAVPVALPVGLTGHPPAMQTPTSRFMVARGSFCQPNLAQASNLFAMAVQAAATGRCVSSGPQADPAFHSGVVWDLFCGSGALTFALASMGGTEVAHNATGATPRLVGIDINEDAIAAATDSAARHGLQATVAFHCLVCMARWWVVCLAYTRMADAAGFAAGLGWWGRISSALGSSPHGHGRRCNTPVAASGKCIRVRSLLHVMWP